MQMTQQNRVVKSGLLAGQNRLYQAGAGKKGTGAVSYSQAMAGVRHSMKSYFDDRWLEHQERNREIFGVCYDAKGRPVLDPEESGEDGMKDAVRAMKIANNMMEGKQVPEKDERFLMHYNMELYLIAKRQQMENKTNKKAKSELEEEGGQEEKQFDGSSAASDGEAVQESAAGGGSDAGSVV